MAIDRTQTQVNRRPIILLDTDSDRENYPPQQTASSRPASKPSLSDPDNLGGSMEYLDTHAAPPKARTNVKEVIEVADSPFGSKSSSRGQGNLFGNSASGSIRSSSSGSSYRPMEAGSTSNRPIDIDAFDRPFGSSIAGQKKSQKSQSRGYGGYIKPATPNAFSQNSGPSRPNGYPSQTAIGGHHVSGAYGQAFRPSPQYPQQYPQQHPLAPQHPRAPFHNGHQPPSNQQKWPTWVTQSQPFPGTYPAKQNYPVPPVKNKDREEQEDDGIEREVFDVDVRLTAADYERHQGDAEAHMRELLSGAVGEGEAEDGGFAEGDDVVEGFAKGVRLMPHQVRGVKWMRSRETGRKYGGILADVCQVRKQQG